ncbi:MAG: LamG domain-containing protein, partial [Bacteroidota bacterium]
LATSVRRSCMVMGLARSALKYGAVPITTGTETHYKAAIFLPCESNNIKTFNHFEVLTKAQDNNKYLSWMPLSNNKYPTGFIHTLNKEGKKCFPCKVSKKVGDKLVNYVGEGIEGGGECIYPTFDKINPRASSKFFEVLVPQSINNYALQFNSDEEFLNLYWQYWNYPKHFSPQTIEFWIQFDDLASQNNSCNILGNLVYVNEGNIKVDFEYRKLRDNTLLHSNKWYHIALTNSGEKLNLFVNGVQVANTTFANEITFIKNNENLKLGGFKGKIENFRLWTKALSSEEIKEAAFATDVSDKSKELLTDLTFNTSSNSEIVINEGYNAHWGGAVRGIVPSAFLLNTKNSTTNWVNSDIPRGFPFNARLKSGKKIRAQNKVQLEVEITDGGLAPFTLEFSDGTKKTIQKKKDIVRLDVPTETTTYKLKSVKDKNNVINNSPIGEVKIDINSQFILDVNGEGYIEVEDFEFLKRTLFIGAWVKNSAEKIESGQAILWNKFILLKLTKEGNLNFLFSADSNKPRGFSGIKSKSIIPPDGKWYHIAARLDYQSGEFALYINGKEDIKENCRYCPGHNSSLYAKSPLIIGGANSSHGSWYNSNGFKGQIDDVVIASVKEKNTKIGPSEILEKMMFEPKALDSDKTSLDLYFDFNDDKELGYLESLTKSLYQGKLEGLKPEHFDIDSKSENLSLDYNLKFDGIDDMVEIPNTEALELGNDFIIEFTYRAFNYGMPLNRANHWEDPLFILKMGAYGVKVKKNNNLTLITWDDDVSFGENTLNTDGLFHKYTITAKGGNERKLFVDGKEIKKITTPYKTNHSTEPIYLMGHPLLKGFTPGALDNVIITGSKGKASFNFNQSSGLTLNSEEGKTNGKLLSMKNDRWIRGLGVGLKRASPILGTYANESNPNDKIKIIKGEDGWIYVDDGLKHKLEASKLLGNSRTIQYRTWKNWRGYINRYDIKFLSEDKFVKEHTQDRFGRIKPKGEATYKKISNDF